MTGPVSVPPGSSPVVGSESTMQAVVVALGETYRDDGIAIWLAAVHKSGPFAGKRPIDVCKTAEGRAEVLAWAESATGMVAT